MFIVYLQGWQSASAHACRTYRQPTDRIRMKIIRFSRAFLVSLVIALGITFATAGTSGAAAREIIFQKMTTLPDREWQGTPRLYDQGDCSLGVEGTLSPSSAAYVLLELPHGGQQPLAVGSATRSGGLRLFAGEVVAPPAGHTRYITLEQVKLEGDITLTSLAMTIDSDEPRPAHIHGTVIDTVAAANTDACSPNDIDIAGAGR